MLQLKRFVTKSEGLTLIETILSLFAFSFILSLTPTVIVFFNNSEELYNYDYDMFVLDVVDEYKKSSQIYLNRNNTAVNFLTERGVISYRLSNQRIVKSVDGAGFITMLFHVERFDLKEDDLEVTLGIHYKNGEKNDTFSFKK